MIHQQLYAVRGGFVAADFGVSKADHAFIIGRYAAADAAIAVQHAGFHADAAVARDIPMCSVSQRASSATISSKF